MQEVESDRLEYLPGSQAIHAELVVAKEGGK